ncbi:MAG: iron-sulfur cluster carrier protein ApbC [Anaerolineae bacterium]
MLGKKGSTVDEAQVLEALSQVMEPELHRDLVSLNMIRDIVVDGSRVSFTIVLTTPACPLTGRLREESTAAVMSLPGVKEVEVNFDSQVPTDRRLVGKLDIGVRNAIAVASGKGGVGKSTVAVNLAVALARSGASVGLLDADIYGPNIPLMMGINEPPTSRDGRTITPLESYGVKLMSMGFLISEETPLIWRGPMIHSVLRQFLSDVDWGGLDYLVIDLPPGTGDAQLTLAQSLPLTGAIIVTTPQDVALADVVKGIAMFQHLEVPVLGVVENMSTFLCPHCGERTDIFGHGGGEQVSDRMGVPFLGEVPIDPRIRLGGDEGRPIAAVAPESPAGKAFLDMAQALAARISVLHLREPVPGSFTPSPELRVIK